MKKICLEEKPFCDPAVMKGAEESIVDEIQSAVIIPGDMHEDLWVHPELVTTPGNPIEIHLRVRSTDRRGRDRHSLPHYFDPGDSFQVFEPVETPASAWDRIGLSLNALDLEQSKVELPDILGHTWSSAYINLDPQTILVPFTSKEGERYYIQSLIARWDDGRLVPIHRSNSWTNRESRRGLYEPHVVEHAGEYYMTARAEDGWGYVLRSDDGHYWKEPTPWVWDDGQKVPMNQTMTKLLSHQDGLLLIYTRIRSDNENAFRNRAPLHCADLDPQTLTLKRSTERIIVPNRGLPVGNFWVWPIDQKESMITVAEWPRDGRQENGDIWLCRVHWKNPNTRMTSEGYRQG